MIKSIFRNQKGDGMSNAAENAHILYGEPCGSSAGLIEIADWAGELLIDIFKEKKNESMLTKTKRIFICGPISGNHIEFLANIKEGIKIGAKMIELGYAPFCPHLDFLYSFVQDIITTEMYRNFCIPWLEVSNLVYLIRESRNIGVVEELKKANELKIEIVSGWQNFLNWHNEQKRNKMEFFR